MTALANKFRAALLPDRQLRNIANSAHDDLSSLLPDRQLRNVIRLLIIALISLLPDRQLRNDDWNAPVNPLALLPVRRRFAPTNRVRVEPNVAFSALRAVELSFERHPFGTTLSPCLEVLPPHGGRTPRAG